MDKILIANYIFRGNVRIDEKLYHHRKVIARGSLIKCLRKKKVWSERGVTRWFSYSLSVGHIYKEWNARTRQGFEEYDFACDRVYNHRVHM